MESASPALATQLTLAALSVAKINIFETAAVIDPGVIAGTAAHTQSVKAEG